MTPLLDAPALEEDLRSRVFARRSDSSGPGVQDRRQVGLEVEAIAIDRSSGRIARLDDEGPRALLSAVRSFASGRGWTETGGPDAPRFRTDADDRISFEPGGQIEWASRPDLSVGELVSRARAVLGGIREALHDRGIELVHRGMDPMTPEDAAPLQVRGARYVLMDRHFGRIGPWGRRMMRQSAAIHVNLDWSHAAARQWKVANQLTPVLTAIFANSRFHAGRDTGHRSFRAAQWRKLAPGRTWVPMRGSEDPVRRYLEFALDAPAFLLDREGEEPLSFRDHLGESGVGLRQWREHLTTLFPEVRPRGYLEIRSLDAIAPEHLEAPVVLLAGILYDDRALGEVEELLPAPSETALERAGRLGLRDAAFREWALALVGIALGGASRQPSLVDVGSLEAAGRFFTDFTLLGKDPGDVGPEGAEGPSEGLAGSASSSL